MILHDLDLDVFLLVKLMYISYQWLENDLENVR